MFGILTKESLAISMMVGDYSYPILNQNRNLFFSYLRGTYRAQGHLKREEDVDS